MADKRLTTKVLCYVFALDARPVTINTNSINAQLVYIAKYLSRSCKIPLIPSLYMVVGYSSSMIT